MLFYDLCFFFVKYQKLTVHPLANCLQYCCRFFTVDCVVGLHIIAYSVGDVLWGFVAWNVAWTLLWASTTCQPSIPFPSQCHKVMIQCHWGLTWLSAAFYTNWFFPLGNIINSLLPLSRLSESSVLRNDHVQPFDKSCLSGVSTRAADSNELPAVCLTAFNKLHHLQPIPLLTDLTVHGQLNAWDFQTLINKAFGEVLNSGHSIVAVDHRHPQDWIIRRTDRGREETIHFLLLPYFTGQRSEILRFQTFKPLYTL